MLKYESIAELVSEAEKQGIRISKLVLKDQAEAMETTELETFEKMELDFQVMVNSVQAGQQKDQRSMSGLTGGEGFAMKDYAERTGGGLCGSFMSRAISRALAVAGCNASMGRIVAAPTAGSCGILPGCLVSLYEDRNFDERDIIMSMFTAAASLVELMGGTPAQCGDACAIAIANQLGLVCDPVAGLVEIPCIKRNVSGLMIAFSSADMALAGIPSRIPVDECIDAMREVGDAIPASLRETAGGGLAATPTGKKLQQTTFVSAQGEFEH